MNRQECPLRTPCGLCSIEKKLCDAICGALENTQESSVKKKSRTTKYGSCRINVQKAFWNIVGA